MVVVPMSQRIVVVVVVALNDFTFQIRKIIVVVVGVAVTVAVVLNDFPFQIRKIIAVAVGVAVVVTGRFFAPSLSIRIVG